VPCHFDRPEPSRVLPDAQKKLVLVFAVTRALRLTIEVEQSPAKLGCASSLCKAPSARNVCFLGPMVEEERHILLCGARGPVFSVRGSYTRSISPPLITGLLGRRRPPWSSRVKRVFCAVAPSTVRPGRCNAHTHYTHKQQHSRMQVHNLKNVINFTTQPGAVCFAQTRTTIRRTIFVTFFDERGNLAFTF
jgi:hypothetical protein